MFIILFLLIIPLCFNAGRETYLWLKVIFPKIKRKTFSIIFVSAFILTLVMFFLSMAKVTWIPNNIIKIYFFIFGFLLYSAIFINIASLINFICKKTKLFSDNILLKLRLIITTSILLIANGLMTYGTINTLNVKTKEYSITINTTQTNKDSLTVGLISDLHLGYIYDDKRVSEIVDRLNQMNVDIVCIVGDIFDGDYKTINNKEKIKSLFQNIKSTYGVYASLGNHDAGKTYDEMIKFINESNITLLRDDYQVIDNKFIIAGRRDSSPIGNHGKDRKETLEIVNPNDLPIIVMDHQPGNISEYDNNIDLILCGHTHQGQFFPLNLFTDLVYDVDYGYYQASIDSPQVIVTSGVGSWGPPQRIGTNSEIVKINISLN